MYVFDEKVAVTFSHETLKMNCANMSATHSSVKVVKAFRRATRGEWQRNELHHRRARDLSGCVNVFTNLQALLRILGGERK